MKKKSIEEKALARGESVVLPANGDFPIQEDEAYKVTLNPVAGDKIKFKAMNEFTGDEMIFEGTVLGNEEAVRKQFPEECGGAENCYLVKRIDNFGNDYLHVVYPEEIIEEA